MIIKNLFTKTYKLVKNNLILIEPLLIYSLITIFIVSPLGLANGITIAKVVLLLSIGCLFCVFTAGWFNMFHKSIQHSARQINSDEEKIMTSLGLLKEFFPGVGQYFFKITAGMIIYLLVLVIIISLGVKLIGIPSFLHNGAILSMNTNAEILKLMDNLSYADKVKTGLWYLLILSSTSILALLTMFWKQAVIALDHKPVTAYWESIKTVFKNPVYSIIIFLSYCITQTFIVIFASLSANFIFQLLILMLIFLSEVYFTMMTFLYFEEFRKNNNNSWPDSFR